MSVFSLVFQPCFCRCWSLRWSLMGDCHTHDDDKIPPPRDRTPSSVTPFLQQRSGVGSSLSVSRAGQSQQHLASGCRQPNSRRTVAKAGAAPGCSGRAPDRCTTSGNVWAAEVQRRVSKSDEAVALGDGRGTIALLHGEDRTANGCVCTHGAHALLLTHLSVIMLRQRASATV